MSGSGTLQQRTTYLISLTLVKVEAVEESGEAKKCSLEKVAEAGQGGRPGQEFRATVETGSLAEVDVEQSAKDSAEMKGDIDKLSDARAKLLSPQRDSLLPSLDVVSKSSKKSPCNFLFSLPPERVTIQKTKSADIFEKNASTSESKTSRSPALTTQTSLPIHPSEQRPVSLLTAHSSVTTRGRDSRDSRERNPASAQSLDRKDCRVLMRSPGPYRASWAEASQPEGWRNQQDETQTETLLEIGGGLAAVMRDIPRKERLKIGSSSLPAPATQAPKPARKGKSRTLDNSDLNSLSEDLVLAREVQQVHHGQRCSAKDRKMLKFISGIFTKSTSGATEPSSTAPPVYIQRDSSEEEGRRLPVPSPLQPFINPLYTSNTTNYCHGLLSVHLFRDIQEMKL